jgi:hypothetical protein
MRGAILVAAEASMARQQAKMIVVQHNGDALLFAGPQLSKAQKKVLRGITREHAVAQFGEAKVREAEQTGLALMPRAAGSAPGAA